MREHQAPADAIASSESLLGLYEERLESCDPAGVWTVSDGQFVSSDRGGGDRGDREARRRKFHTWAECVARGNNLVPAAATPEQAVQAWLHLLKGVSPFYVPGLSVIERLFEASSVMCCELETRAAATVVTDLKRDVSPLLTIKKAAELLTVCEDTIRKMGRDGEIKIIRLGPRRQRIPASEIHRLRNTPRFWSRTRLPEITRPTKAD